MTTVAKLPNLSADLLALIGSYGLARTDGVSEVERVHRWQQLIDGIKQYATDCVAASLSPAELGGVEGPLRVFSEGAWVYEETGQRFSARDLDEAAFAEYLRHPLSTPRAAEADWLPIESAPKDGSSFLVYLPDERRQIQVAWQNANGVMAVGSCFSFDLSPITHWRPLPAPPALTPPSAKGEL